MLQTPKIYKHTNVLLYFSMFVSLTMWVAFT